MAGATAERGMSIDMASTLERIGYKLSPAALNAYYRCPRKFQMRYLRRVRTPHIFTSYLVIGSVTHKALATRFRQLRDGLPRDSLESCATGHLLREKYPPDTADELRAEHLPVIMGHMERALAVLPPDMEVLHVEKEFAYRTSFSSIAESVSLVAKVDLVIAHGGDGVVDHVDFKTGGQTGDLFQNVLSRVTVAHGLGVRDAQLRTVNLMTKSSEYQVVPSHRDDHRSTWQVIRESIASLASDDSWVGASDPVICRWCEFNKVCDSAANDSSDDDDRRNDR